MGPGTFSDRGYLLFQVGILTEDLPGRIAVGNVTNLVFIQPRICSILATYALK